MLSCFSHVRLFVTPWTVARQASLFMGFSRQEYWSGLSCPPSGDLPDPGIEPVSPSFSCTEGRFFIGEPPGKFMIDINCSITKQFHSWIFIQVIYCLIYSGNKLLLIKKKWTPDSRNNLGKSQNSYAKWKKSDSKGYLLNDSIYMPFLKRDSYSNRE